MGEEERVICIDLVKNVYGSLQSVERAGNMEQGMDTYPKQGGSRSTEYLQRTSKQYHTQKW